MLRVELVVNGQDVRRDVPDNMLLSTFLREEVQLTGTHIGCDTTQCGACVVSIDGETVKSCTMLALQANRRSVTTIEGIANGSELHPMQRAFSECHGLQCGYCTPGMVIAAIDIVERSEEPLTAARVREELKGNLCRCTGYVNIVKSVLRGAELMGRPVDRV
ncbi:MAG: (2Fe-2S)-binding protein [Mesorhizobium sp.]|nr:(2Fe-2S)-binding protein [Mesorhizobium sp.]MCO5162708.1 (2Fe-2S)-binding protein [Mesorhizobium sp.]